MKYLSFLIIAINFLFLQISTRGYCAQQGDSGEGAGGGSRHDEEVAVNNVFGICYHISFSFGDGKKLVFNKKMEMTVSCQTKQLALHIFCLLKL